MNEDIRHYPRITNFRGETIIKPEGVCGEWAPDKISVAYNEITCPECLKYIATYGRTEVKHPSNIRHAASCVLING